MKEMHVRRFLMLKLMAAAINIGAIVIPAGAQEFRIYTRVFAPDPAGGAEHVMARSLSLFHAGKVYDRAETGPDAELVVFEPAHQRFEILHVSKSLATSVHFDELNHRMKLAADTVRAYIGELEQQKQPGAAEGVAALRFGLEPSFEESFDNGQIRLTLASPFVTYRAQGTKAEAAEIAEAFRRYADWTARLNYALHPRAPYPGPRLALNERLRQRQLIPVQVELETRMSSPGRLRAEHQIQWQLDAKDRDLIHEWERALRSEKIRRVTFREYQQIVLGASEGERRVSRN